MFSTKANFLGSFFPISGSLSIVHHGILILDVSNSGQWCCISIKQLRGNTRLKANLHTNITGKKVCLKAIYKNFCKFDMEFVIFKRGKKTASRFDIFRLPPVFYILCCNFSVAEMVQSNFWIFILYFQFI